MKRTFAFVLLSLFSAQLFAWSGMGHDVVVEIAKRHLTPKAKEGIARYMPYDITRDSRWMDKNRSDPELLYMYHFHEQCINLETLEYDPNAQVEKGDIMRGLFLAEYNLSHREHLSDSVVVLNIRMLLHFMGDLHCPVHIGVPGIWFPKPPYREDKGKWYWKGTAYQSFHKLIDRAPGILNPDLTAVQLAEKLDKKIPRSRSRKWTRGDFVDWTNDAARSGFRIYDYFPPLWEIPDSPEPKYIPDDFLDNTEEILNEALLKAGYRLAHVLNNCFR